jgi:hypothetical protein
LNLIDKSVPAEFDVHVIVDNSSTHKRQAIQTLAAPPPPLAWTPSSSTLQAAVLASR